MKRTPQVLALVLMVACFTTVLWGCKPATTPLLVTDKVAVTVPENGIAGFQVKLSSVPSSDVTVTVAWQGGDADITVQSGTNLTFTTSNWSVYQPVVLAAANDADATNGSATIRCSAPGLADVEVTATELDDDTALAPKALVGWVRDTAGQAITGAAVTAGTHTSSTDATGLFRFESVEQTAALLTSVEATGYTANSRAVDTASVDLPTANFVLKLREAPQTLNVDTGGTVQDGLGNTLTLAAKSLVTKDGKSVTGNVDVSITALNVTVAAELKAFPGTFDGVALVRKAGETVQLETFALAEYDVRQNGVKLQLNTPGSIRLKLNDNRLAVDAVVPLWFFNEATGLWEETGNGTVKSDGHGGLYWEANIPHLCWWNSDRPINEKQCLTGKVLDQLGNPVSGAQVYGDGLDYSGSGSATTGSDGQYCMDVKCGSTVRVSAVMPWAALPMDSKDVVMPDLCGVTCAGGICVELPALAASFPACIEGHVRSSGAAVSGATVYSSVGASAVTDVDGYYKISVPANVDIAVYVLRGPATIVTSSAQNPPCVQVDFPPVAGSEGEGEPGTETVMLPGSVPLAMVWVPAGTFMMGRNASEQNSLDSEDPRHEVTLSHGFWMGKYELTQAQWKAVMNGANPSYFQGANAGNANTDNRPVEQVAWDTVQTFITALNAHIVSTNQGAAMRLPTEAEWEYACRAGSTTRFYWGDDPDYTLIGAYAWYSGNDSPFATKDVGGKIPNAFGLYDMSGNVDEFVQDWYDYYPYTPAVTDPAGPATGTKRVFRGGWVGDYGGYCRSAYRNGYGPLDISMQMGFRLAR